MFFFFLAFQAGEAVYLLSTKVVARHYQWLTVSTETHGRGFGAQAS